MEGVVPERDGQLYETDEHAWLLRQAEALRARRLASLDPDNLAEFLEDMAKRDRREVGARLRVLLVHLLKFQIQPERAGRSWAVTVLREQNHLADLLDAASLRGAAEAAWETEWQRARREASRETGLPITRLPETNPWTLDEALGWNPPEDTIGSRRRGNKR
jgi:hypothetical protein